MNSTLTLTQEWDKTFPQNEAVDHCKVTFHNRFGIELAADLYKPKNAAGKLAAVAVSGPFGAVKEQCSGLYAQELAARGFQTVAFDPSYTGESGGTPRYVASPDINTEDFSAAVDFLSVRDDVDPERIGILDRSRLAGIITDGDLRRHMGPALMDKKAKQVMHPDPVVVGEDTLAVAALRLMQENKITSLFVTNEEKPVGILNVHDCLRAGVE